MVSSRHSDILTRICSLQAAPVRRLIAVCYSRMAPNQMRSVLTTLLKPWSVPGYCDIRGSYRTRHPTRQHAFSRPGWSARVFHRLPDHAETQCHLLVSSLGFRVHLKRIFSNEVLRVNDILYAFIIFVVALGHKKNKFIGLRVFAKGWNQRGLVSVANIVFASHPDRTQAGSI